MAQTGTHEVDGNRILLGEERQPTSFGPPNDYRLEGTTVWSFPGRGSWATHVGNYRGNWSPYIPRNVIEHYSNPGETILDQMVGSGTSMVEAKLLGRKGIGVDINPAALAIATDRLRFEVPGANGATVEPLLYQGDARRLTAIADESVDLVLTHPPYAGIVNYSSDEIAGDLSTLRHLEEFVDAMADVATEAYRVLKPGRHCTILIGDSRHGQHVVPITARILDRFLQAGFFIKEDIIKLQHNTKATRETWRARKYDFYKIAHEHLYVFRKPSQNEATGRLAGSSRWR